MTHDLEGHVWYADRATPRVGESTALPGGFAEYSLSFPPSAFYGITEGADRRMWYANRGANKIGVLTLAGTGVAEYTLPAGSLPQNVTSGPDNSVWFSNQGTNKIGKIIP